MLINIFNFFITAIATALPSCAVTGVYPEVAETFPIVVMSETVNRTYEETVDTSGEKHAFITITFDIFSQAEDKLNEVRTIRETIDSIMADTYRMTRDNVGEVANYSDPSIYRYIVRYSGVVDSTKKIHRR